MPMTRYRVLREATFNRKVRSYWLLSGTTVMALTIVGIPLIPIWLLIGTWATERYLQHMSCSLTERSLKLSKGIFVRQEKTVPLDKITDVALVEGPIMRYLDLQAVKVETAGSSTGAFLTIVGIENTREFRDAILDQRDLIADRDAEALEGRTAEPAPGGHTSGDPRTADAQLRLLAEIRDTLVRIESRIDGDGAGPATGSQGSSRPGS